MPWRWLLLDNSHYFKARLPEQFDAVLHIDETHVREPLEAWSRDEDDCPKRTPRHSERNQRCTRWREMS